MKLIQDQFIKLLNLNTHKNPDSIDYTRMKLSSCSEEDKSIVL